MEQAATMELRVSDVSGQRRYRATSVPAQATVGELVSGLLSRMGLARNDSAGRPLSWRARLEREGRHLNSGEVIGEAARTGDEISLQPNIDAG